MSNLMNLRIKRNELEQWAETLRGAMDELATYPHIPKKEQPLFLSQIAENLRPKNANRLDKNTPIGVVFACQTSAFSLIRLCIWSRLHTYKEQSDLIDYYLEVAHGMVLDEYQKLSTAIGDEMRARN